MKKFVSILCILILSVAQISFMTEVVPMKAEAAIDFSCGQNLIWYLNTRTKTLTISGTGDMFDYTGRQAPWNDYYGSIDYVVIGEGVTHIGNSAFYYCGIEKVTIPASVETISRSAFGAYGNVVEFDVAVESKLRQYDNFTDNNILNTTWYKSQPDGPVYLGRMLCGYKGEMPENYSLEVREGTYAINEEAFYDQSNLVNIVVPKSVGYVGVDAFKGTAWYDSQPEGVIYIGNALYEYKGTPTIEETDFVIKSGTVSITDKAFYEKKVITTVSIPSSLKHIGESAFYYCTTVKSVSFEIGSCLEEIGKRAFVLCTNLKEFYVESTDLMFPDTLKKIGEKAFSNCSQLKRSVNIPASVVSIGDKSFRDTYITAYNVSDDNMYYCSDEYGILYNKDKSVLLYAPGIPGSKEIILPEGVETIGEYAFYHSVVTKVVLPSSLTTLEPYAFYKSTLQEVNIPEKLTTISQAAFTETYLSEIEIPNNITTIYSAAFSNMSKLRKVTIPKETVNISNNPFSSIFGTEELIIYCFTDSAAHNMAVEYGISYVLLDELPEEFITDSINSTIEKAQNITRDFYSDESLAELDAAVSAVDLNAENLSQSQVDEWENAINSAIANLKYKPADYYAVETAQKRAENLDRSLYTDESLAFLDSALNSVEENLDITNQSKVNSIAREINETIDNLEYLPADYAKVEAAISESSKYDRRLYSQATLAVLDQSISAVEYGLNITEQTKVDGFAEQINNAISALEYAAVVLRNEPHGVIVSATAKEIDPDTTLTVDLKDSSDLQSGNFAVGGTVKNITLYDINLLLNAQKTQPDGFVTVKIKLPDGVDPKRCKVYHVIDDPVDPLVRYTTALEGNFIVFETDHFSEFAVIEVETVLDSIEITKQPNKTIYTLGETVNTSGLEVTAHYSDGSTKIVSDYDVSSIDTSSIGTKTITVYHTYNGITKSASFEITVNGDKIAANITLNGEDINEYNKKVAWYKGYSSESVKLDCNVSGNYKVEWSSDNPNVLVDSNGNVTNKGFFFARKATITVKITDSVGNILATDSIVVRFYKFSFQLSSIQSTMIQVFRKSGLIY